MAQVFALDTIETPKAPVSSTYHGVTVTEDYRWLEDTASAQTRAWTMAGGHGLGNSLDQRVSELADVYAFLLDRLGVDCRS
jgi:protease II